MKSRHCCKNLFLVYAILFFLCGVSFIIAPNFVLTFINDIGKFQSYFSPLEPSSHRFWLVLTFSMMMMISYASLMVYKGIFVRAYINILLLSKFVSSVSYLIFLFIEQAAFGYLVGFVVDGAIFLSILFVRNRIEAD